MYLRKKDKYSSHTIIADIIYTLSKPKTRILDLGCDVGFLGKTLKDLSIDFEIYGVDINKKNLEKAKNIYKKTYLFDLNLESWPIHDKFEIIVLADTLEHLVNPNIAITNVLKLLKTGGKLIISVPNIVFWWSRIQILLGKFPKENRGIFDKTHLHHYTNRTIHQLIKSYSELRIVNFYPTNLPFQFVLKKYTDYFLLRLIYNLNYILAKKWPNLFTYQFIIVSSKK